MKSSNSDSLQLSRVAFYGRTLSEYLRIFDLDLDSWQGHSILDCPAGASSFVAEACRRGIQAVGCDPLFGQELRTLIKQGEADVEHVIDRLHHVAHLYKWEFYPSVDALKEFRTSALRGFETDYESGLASQRYVKAALPNLPFADRSFGLVLSGHFLFTYCDRFDYRFHLDSALELFRVCAAEVRIYPLQGPDSKPYPHMRRLLSDLKKAGVTAEIVPVPFEFQRGSNRMLRMRR